MHKPMVKELKNFYGEYREFVNKARIAELGSYNINGSIRKYVPKLTGFDILKGQDVDVVIKPFEIPEEHIGKYDLVISASSFQCCPDSVGYKKEVVDLLDHNGMLWLCTCAPSCKRNHSTSPNKYFKTGSIRLSIEQMKELFRPDIEPIKVYISNLDGHHDDIIFIGRKL